MGMSWDTYHKDLVKEFNQKLCAREFLDAQRIYERINQLEQPHMQRSTIPFGAYSFRLDSKKGYRHGEAVH